MLHPRITNMQVCILCLAFLSCDQPFDPRADTQAQPVIFSILSTDRNAQFVRVEPTYMLSSFDASTQTTSNAITGALVVINDGKATYRFRDTTLPRSDTSRFGIPLHAYVLSPFTPSHGVSYTITVQASRFGTAVGTAVVPTRATVAMGASAATVLENPGNQQDDAGIPFEVLFSDEAKGYIARLILDYSVWENNKWTPHRAEVPIRFKYVGLDDFKYVEYAQITHHPTTRHTTIAYTKKSYTATLIDIAYKRFPTAKIVFNRSVFYLLQVERNLFDYYLVAHAYNDPHSMRVDEPLYTNIIGGVGLVGAYTLDSTIHVYAADFAFNRQ